MKVCIKCFENKEEDLFVGKRNTCKKCCNAYERQWRKDNKEKYHSIQNKNARSLKTRFRYSKRAAEKRNKIWNLSFDDYSNHVNQACFYCNGFFPATEVGVGLDRIDSSKGYITDNVISCCGTCNRIKGDYLSLKETIAVVKFIITLRS